MFHIKCARICTCLCICIYISLIFQFLKHGDGKQCDDKSLASTILRVNVSDQVCEAEKDEDGHALNLKGENYFHLTWELFPLIMRIISTSRDYHRHLSSLHPLLVTLIKRKNDHSHPHQGGHYQQMGVQVKRVGMNYSQEKWKISAHQILSCLKKVNHTSQITFASPPAMLSQPDNTDWSSS